MHLLGFLAAILIGVSLGLIGGGGSILTVPVLVYIFGIDPLLATTYSLLIVGISSSFGVIAYFRQGLINTTAIGLFGLPSVVSIFITRKFILPQIPDTLFQWGQFTLTKELLIMVLFSVLMIAASYSMIKSESKSKPIIRIKESRFVIGVEGALVGFLTGLVGVGGGFLIIPALVMLGKIPVKEAIGTSLAIIVINSIIGFLSSLGHHSMDWTLLLSVSAFAVLGIFLGTFLSKKLNGQQLKPAFGWFVLIMGIYILIRETVLQA
ncbi:sulfite exporter TauE/SafE family protein [Marinilongibacter aquaticus]|uniref:sulfite exporter TauE/SafE family protein n=1 Tax=Marinilongibacter aquaticus TaxID=2975157 RepID=UPI0021BDA2FD|nr:sulfite exporter TauE/SafE family protein [Marinilongibacter aquaticus]UBM58545.1 sulfite exporter TauE/SafE family protein [Marinilongibacter aquaticus]